MDWNSPRLAACTIASAVVLGLAAPALANQKTCEEGMPEIRALIDGIPSGADKNTANNQFGKAQENLAAGNERRCLLYLESARAAVEAEMLHEN